MKTIKDFCDNNCNECSLLFAEDEKSFNALKQMHVLLDALELAFGEGVTQIANMICPNLTCCPNCHIDDFSHFENCEIEKASEKIVKKWKSQAE